MLKKSILLLIGVPIFIVMFLGNNAMSANCENPDSLTFAMIPTEETVAELNLYKPITDRMAKLTGKKINIENSSNFTNAFSPSTLNIFPLPNFL